MRTLCKVFPTQCSFLYRIFQFGSVFVFRLDATCQFKLILLYKLHLPFQSVCVCLFSLMANGEARDREIYHSSRERNPEKKKGRIIKWGLTVQRPYSIQFDPKYLAPSQHKHTDMSLPAPVAAVCDWEGVASSCAYAEVLVSHSEPRHPPLLTRNRSLSSPPAAACCMRSIKSKFGKFSGLAAPSRGIASCSFSHSFVIINSD